MWERSSSVTVTIWGGRLCLPGARESMHFWRPDSDIEAHSAWKDAV